jgi:hypothetical protein
MLSDVLDLLRRVEQYRAALDIALDTLHGWLDRSEELCHVWNKFTQQGGITANDFAAVFNNRCLPRRPVVRQRRHLRIITNNETPRRRLADRSG